MARYYTVAVDYYSGQHGPEPLSTAATPVVDFIATCASTGQDALAAALKTVRAGASLVVRCPKECAGQADFPVYTSTAGVYLFTSSVCRAAVHDNKIANADGGTVTLTLSTGGSLTRGWTVGKLPAGVGTVAAAVHRQSCRCVSFHR